MTNTYGKKFNAKRAAIAMLGPDAIEGTDFQLVAVDRGWAWQAAGTPATETPEPIPDDAPPETSEPIPHVEASQPALDEVQAAPVRKRRTGTKQEIVIDLLRRPEGATVEEMMAATGWQKHTVRGAIAGALKKKLGLDVVSEKEAEGSRTYRIRLAN